MRSCLWTLLVIAPILMGINECSAFFHSRVLAPINTSRRSATATDDLKLHLNPFLGGGTTSKSVCGIQGGVLQSKKLGEDDETTTEKEKERQWTHSDIEWRLRPPKDSTTKWQRIKLLTATNLIRFELKLKGEVVPPVLCPKGGQAVLQGYKNGKQIARFGFTTTRGPPALPIDETITDIYNIPPGLGGGAAGAIIYMFVEPEYRGNGIGSLSLEAIAAIQTVQGCDFTVLVADDDGSGKLVRWYEENGYTLAPKLQDIFGSPGGKYGVTMIRPTQVRSDIFARCTIKWW